MNSFLAVLFTTLVYTFVGSGYAKVLNLPSKLEFIGLSFLMGSGLTTLGWFIGFRLGFDIDLVSYFSVAIIIWLIGKTWARSNGKSDEGKKKIKLNVSEKTGVGIILTLAVVHFTISSYNPITSWDSIALYDFAGRIIAINNNLKGIIDNAYYMSYPLMVSLSHAAVYMLRGINAQGLHSILFFALLTIVYGRMLLWTNRRVALITTLLVAANYQLYYYASYAYTNIPYTVFLVASMLYTMSYGKTLVMRRRLLLVAAVLLSLSTWVRSSEPFWIVGLVLIAWQCIRFRFIGTGITAALMVYVTRQIWGTFQQQVFVNLGFSNPPKAALISTYTFERITSNLPELTWYTLLNIIFPYMALWLLCIPAIIIAIIKKDVRLIQIMTAITLVFCMVIGGIAVFSTYYTTWNSIGDSATRMVLFIVPLAIIAGIYAAWLVKGKGVNEKGE